MGKKIALPYQVKPPVRANSGVLSFRLPQKMKEELEDFADSQNISVGHLLKSWIMEVIVERRKARLHNLQLAREHGQGPK